MAVERRAARARALESYWNWADPVGRMAADATRMMYGGLRQRARSPGAVVRSAGQFMRTSLRRRSDATVQVQAADPLACAGRTREMGRHDRRHHDLGVASAIADRRCGHVCRPA